MPKLFWTPERDQILKSRYANEGAIPLVEELGTTARAISKRAARLGL